MQSNRHGLREREAGWGVDSAEAFISWGNASSAGLFPTCHLILTAGIFLMRVVFFQLLNSCPCIPMDIMLWNGFLFLCHQFVQLFFLKILSSKFNKRLAKTTKNGRSILCKVFALGNEHLSVLLGDDGAP